MDNRKKGYIMSIVGCCFWGLSGNLSQYMFEISSITPMVVITFRMLVSSLIFLSLSALSAQASEIKRAVSDKKIMSHMVIYAIFGMICTQLPFFSTIKHSNAAFATLIQFLSPIFIMLYMLFRYKKTPTPFEIFTTILILSGIVLLITDGDLSGVVVTPKAIAWGVLAAFGYAFYVYYAKNFFGIPSLITMGLSMMIGGIILFIFLGEKNALHYFMDMRVLLCFSANIIIGTVIPFYLITDALRYITPQESALLSACEPLTALIIAIAVFHNKFGNYQLVGATIVMITIVIMGLGDKKANEIKSQY